MNDGGVTFFNRITLFGILAVQGLFFLSLNYAVFISKAASREGMGTTLKVVLTVVAVIFALLWGLVAVVNLIKLDRDTLAPEWIQSCFGIYLFTCILLFGFKSPRKPSVQSISTSLKNMGSQA